MSPADAIVTYLMLLTLEGDSAPAKIPLVSFASVSETLAAPVCKLPKSCALPVDAMVTNSMVSVSGLEYPSANNPRVLLANPLPSYETADKSPKSVALPVVSRFT